MTKDEKRIWDLLAEEIPNPYGIAGIMGNLKVESGMNPLCMTGKNASEWEALRYAMYINSGTYPMEKFGHDGIAFGLAQWLFWSRKEALYKYAIGKDIGSIDTQIGFLLEELFKYKTVLNTVRSATSVAEASDIFMLKYEKPGNTSDAAKAKRAEYGQKYYIEHDLEQTKMAESELTCGKSVMTTDNNVNVRSGPGIQFPIIGRIFIKGFSYPWIATAGNGWHAILLGEKKCGWVSPDYSVTVDSGS